MHGSATMRIVYSPTSLVGGYPGSPLGGPLSNSGARREAKAMSDEQIPAWAAALRPDITAQLPEARAEARQDVAALRQELAETRAALLAKLDEVKRAITRR